MGELARLFRQPEHQLAQPVQRRLQTLRVGDEQHAGDEQGDGDLSHAVSIAPPGAFVVAAAAQRL